jgi:hypothetical protein
MGLMMERDRLQDYHGNGEKAKPTFSTIEMQHRMQFARSWRT